MPKATRKLQSAVNRLKRRKPKARSGVKYVSGTKISSKRFNTKLIALSVGSVLIVLIFYVFVFPLLQIVLEFRLQEDPTASELQKTAWNGSDRLIILGIGLDEAATGHKFVDGLNLFVVEPDTSRLGIFAIDPDLNVFVPSLNSRVNLRTLYNSKAAKGKEVTVMVKAVENLLAIRVDRYLISDKEGFTRIVDNFGSLPVTLTKSLSDDDVKGGQGEVLSWNQGEVGVRPSELVQFMSVDSDSKDNKLKRHTNIFSEIIKNNDTFANFLNLNSIAVSFQENVRTNISNQEALSLLRSLMGIRSDQIRTAYTKSSSSIYRSTSGVYKSYDPVYESIDKDLSSILYDLDIAKERARIEVLNGSGKNGMAGSKARWISNTGARVIKVGNNRDLAETTQIFIPEKSKYSRTLKEIQRIFNNKVQIFEQEFKDRHLGDIVIVIGADAD